VAVLRTFWSHGSACVNVGLPLPLVVVSALVNFVGMSFGIGNNSRVMISLSGAETTFLYPWRLTLYQDHGWLRGGPEHEAKVRALIP
jgi:hypothetical protein